MAQVKQALGPCLHLLPAAAVFRCSMLSAPPHMCPLTYSPFLVEQGVVVLSEDAEAVMEAYTAWQR